MTASPNPFHAAHVLLFLGTLTAGYGVGGLLKFKHHDPWLNVGLRTSLGVAALFSLVALVITHGNTVLLPLALFFVLSFSPKFDFHFYGLKALGWKGLAAIFSGALGLFLIEAYRIDLRELNGVNVGFADIAFYANFSQAMFESGSEGLPNNLGTSLATQPLLYHMGDLWFSGIYSHYFGVVPQYAYGLISRTVSLFCFLLTLTAWVRQVSGQWLWGLLGSLMALFAVETVVFDFSSIPISLFQFFVLNWPLYASGPSMNVAFVTLPLLAASASSASLWPLVGLVLAPSLNPGLMLALPAGLIFMMALKVLSPQFFKPLDRFIPFTFRETGILLLVSILPFVWSMVSGRSQTQSPNITELGYLYQVAHTFFRAGLSQVYILPVLIGLSFFGTYSFYSKTFVLAVGGWLGILASFSLLFPYMQGNTVQMLSLFNQSFIIPLAVIGFSHAFAHPMLKRKWLAIGFVLLAGFSNVRMAWATKFYSVIFENTISPPQFNSLTKQEFDGWSKQSASKPFRVGYWVNPNVEHLTSTPHYTEFTGYAGLLNGVTFQRLNLLPNDLGASLEMSSWFKRSMLSKTCPNSDASSIQCANEALKAINPDAVLTLSYASAYVLPNEVADQFLPPDTIGRFVIHQRKK